MSDFSACSKLVLLSELKINMKNFTKYTAVFLSKKRRRQKNGTIQMAKKKQTFQPTKFVKSFHTSHCNNIWDIIYDMATNLL